MIDDTRLSYTPPMPGRLKVFIATSLDGFIAGPGDDLSWLPAPEPESPAGDFGYGAFMAGIGALLMGRRTYDVVAGFEGEWPYGDRPVLVPTHRPLTPKVPTVRAVSGEIGALVSAAHAAAGERDVYIDGGELIRQALQASLVDELTVTVIPIALGAGVPLFAGLKARRAFVLEACTPGAGGAVQLRYRPA